MQQSIRKERCLLRPIDSDLHAACDNNEPRLVSKLLAQGADPQSQDPLRNYRTPLIRAALNNSYEIVIILLLSHRSQDSQSMYLCDDQGDRPVTLKDFLSLLILATPLPPSPCAQDSTLFIGRSSKVTLKRYLSCLL